MHVRQLSINYLPEQDRILVRVNTAEHHELQFWFTRRLTLGLMPLFERILTEQVTHSGGPATTHLATADPLAKKAMAEFARAETISQADFSTPYRTPEASQPVFDSPLLITDVSVASQPGAQLRLNCAEKISGTPKERRFELALSQQLTHAFMHLLERAVETSQWHKVGAADNIRTAGTPPTPADAKPDYLN